MFQEIKKLDDAWKKFKIILSNSQKKHGIFILIMSLLGAIAEMLGVSIIIPFINAMVNYEQLMQNKYLIPLIQLLNIQDSSQLVMLLGIIVALVYIIKNIYLTLLSYCRVRYSAKIKRELSVLMMESYMNRGYLFFTQANASVLLRGVTNDIDALYQIIYNAFRVIAELLTAIAIVVFIMFTDLAMAVCVIFLACICFIVIVLGFRRPVQRLGIEYQESTGEVNKHSLQALQGIKEVIVMHRQNFFIKRHENALKRQQRALIGQTVASESPAYIIEAVCVAGLILAVSFRILGGKNAMTFIPQLAAFAVGAFRILPSLGRMTSCINQIIYYAPALNSVYENVKGARDFAIKRSEENTLSEEQNRMNLSMISQEEAYLSIENVYWQYPSSGKMVLSGVNIRIDKGASVAFIGQSGAGKTTLADIILGLYNPQKGCIKLNGIDIRQMSEKWCKYVGYIPQTVYLTDDTIRNNVAFGIDESDDKLVWEALGQAQLQEFVEGLPNKLDTVVGDRGMRFSGGQRQRIAIARALYYNPPILILDEATSALDTDTEIAVMDAINSLQGKKTLIIIAHRLSTIQGCDAIYEIIEGKAILREGRLM